MKKPIQAATMLPGKYYWIAGFILLYILSVYIHLGYLPLNNEEPRRALVSIEMLQSGNYIMPTTMGWEYYNKPPLYNWIMSFFMNLTGSSSETIVRLPSLIFILLWGVCNYYIMCKWMPKTVALLSSFFLLTSFDIFFYGLSNGGEIDIFYSFIVYLQVVSIFYFGTQKKWISLYLYSYLFCAIGFMTKGFPSLMFEGLTLLAFAAYAKSARFIFRWQHLAGLGILAAVVGGYLYLYSSYSSPGRLMANLLKESFNKSALGDHQERFVRKIAGYPIAFFKLLLPWSLLLLLLLKKHTFKLWSNPIIRFSVLFILFNIPVYWISGTPRMRYVYMFIPFCMVILAYIFYEFRKEYPVLVNKIMHYTSMIFLLVFAGILASVFLLDLNYVWLALSVLLLVLFLYLYRKTGMHKVWYFVTGIVLVRLIYALVFIPVKSDSARLKYEEQMKIVAAANHFQPISIYGRPEMVDLTIDFKFSKMKMGSIVSLPFIAYQLPYYYYKSSGKLMTYDTVLHKNQNYIGMRSRLGELNPEIVYFFDDKYQGNERVMLFRVPEQYSVNP